MAVLVQKFYDELEKTFEEWWEKEGKYIDPDTSDVPWFDKRKELCFYAYKAGGKKATDDDTPQYVCIGCGCKFSNHESYTGPVTCPYEKDFTSKKHIVEKYEPKVSTTKPKS